MAQTSCVMQLCRGKDSAKKGYTKMSGAMAECNLLLHNILFAQQEFARQKSTKTRLFPHVPSNNLWTDVRSLL